MKRGYAGLYIDNVNLIRRVSLSNNKEVVPRSRRSKRRISNAVWRRTVARFTRQIRRAMPRTKIAHNVIWFAPGAKGKWGRMQTRSANVITLERGVNDAGLTGGTFTFGLRTFLRYSDWVHRRKADVMFLETVSDARTGATTASPGYFMVNNGRDTYGTLDAERSQQLVAGLRGQPRRAEGQALHVEGPAAARLRSAAWCS